MKIVEVRRHSVRGKDKGLSEEGRRIAREAAKTLSPPYALLIASPKERARETMEAFGYEDYEEDERFTTIRSPVIEKLEEKLEALAEAKGVSLLEAMFLDDDAKNALKEWGGKFLDAVIDVAKDLNEGEKALVVFHGGSIEPAALLAFDEFDLKHIGGPLGYCEGVAFIIQNGNLSEVRALRF